IEDIGLRRPSLDDVFLRLTGRGAAEADADPTTPSDEKATRP
ncbi:daunorubicin/doxorubicin resistance ABC transporter ATP-binding protein DrrA, partial [Streptomyces albidoflavus]